MPFVKGQVTPGGGRPKGSKSASTIQRELVLDAVRERIEKSAQRILSSQMSLALGQQFLYKIHTNAKGTKERPKLITDEPTIQAYLNGDLEDNEDNDWYYITTKEPVNQAIDSMFDRTFGRASQSVDLTTNGKDLPTPIYGSQSREK